MRTFELRIYTLSSQAAADAYLTVYYPNHQVSMPKLVDVTVHGYWSPVGSPVDGNAFQVYVLLSYPEGVDPAVATQQYRADPESARNMPGFDPAVILGVSSTMLAPGPASPLC